VKLFFVVCLILFSFSLFGCISEIRQMESICQKKCPDRIHSVFGLSDADILHNEEVGICVFECVKELKGSGS
jgi:hypothetical protein